MLPAVTCCARAGMVVPSVAVSLRGVWTSVVALRSFVSVVAGGGVRKVVVRGRVQRGARLADTHELVTLV